ncbi:tetratricopeptide repeat protein [Patescibacteria group bacterium]|nr:tetratricopeptide repeat protein [Patescibacteria group bacterium]
MRKFTAFITAIVLALLVVTGILAFRNGASIENLNLNKVSELWNSLFTSDKTEEVKVEIEEVNIPIEEENLSYDERIEKGDYYYDRGFLTFASNEYVKAANLEQNRIEPYQKLLLTNLELGDYDKASINAEVILDMVPGDLETQFLLAQIYIKQSEFESAETILDTLLASDIKDARISYYKGLLRIVFDDHDGGRKYLKQALSESNDDNLDKKINYFLNSYTEYEFAKAAEELYLAELLSRAFNKAEEYEMAIYKLKSVLKTRSDLRDAWVLFGFAYLNLENYYFAQSAFERAYELDSQWPTTQYFLGLTHAELGNTDEAVIYLNYSLSNLFEPEIVVHQKLADLYLETQDYESAVKAYEKVLELNNQDINSFVRPVWIYLDFLNQPDKAIVHAEAAVIAFPDNALSYNLLGWSQTGTGDQMSAEENLLKAIDMDPNLAAAQYNLGRLYESQNRKSMALEAYQKAYELDSSGSIGNLSAQRYNDLKSQ